RLFDTYFQCQTPVYERLQSRFGRRDWRTWRRLISTWWFTRFKKNNNFLICINLGAFIFGKLLISFHRFQQ
ncbi:MAG TPA: hypothetical protein ACHBX0_12320, partial [Arsenophonus sp.]